jgi:hypothetical protein
VPLPHGVQNLRKFKIKCTQINVGLPWKSRHGVAGSAANSASDRVSGIIYNECTVSHLLWNITIVFVCFIINDYQHKAILLDEVHMVYANAV